MIAILALKLMERGLGPKAAKLAAWGMFALLASLALWAAYSWAWDRGRDYERDRWEAAAAKIEAADAKADAAATVKAAETKGQVDAGNERAANAAAASDDPLAAGFDSLRGEGGRQGN